MNCITLINFIIVFAFGLGWGLLELVVRYDLRYVGISKKNRNHVNNGNGVELDKEESAIWYVVWYLLLNGAISILALFLLKYCAHEPLGDVSKIEFKNLIIAGFGGIIILRSSVFSILYNEKEVAIGLLSVAQALLDKIDKKIKHNIAAKRICEIYEIVKEVDYEVAKDELPYLCIKYIDDFTEKDSKNLINAIKEINGNLSGINKSLQLGREIAKYCDVEILKRAVKKLPVKKDDPTQPFNDRNTKKDEFETRKEKLNK